MIIPYVDSLFAKRKAKLSRKNSANAQRQVANLTEMSNQESTEMKVTVKVQTINTDSSGESGKSATLNLNS